MDFSKFAEYWRDRIERDLRPFADPGTVLSISGERRQITAQWTARGNTREATFSISLDQGIIVRHSGCTFSYKSFLSSPLLGDLLGLAKMILASQSVAPRPPFVPTKARLADTPAASPIPAVQLLRETLEGPTPELTRIVMVTGEAGAGKTRVLQELVRDQAERYLKGQTDCLYLYINAQGRALARFNEALATELQDLRATLTYHGVTPLVRLGVLVPVIDGFDELLGVGGYDDAFSSLRAFIDELDGQGQIVASARSTYYEQEFVARAGSVSGLGRQAWTQIPVEVIPWGDEELSIYVELYAQQEELDDNATAALRSRLYEIFAGQNAELRRKPLFVARTVDVLHKEPAFAGGDDLLKDLVLAYLERERKEKLLDRHGRALLERRHMELLFKTLAEEMWNQETRELDRRSVREVAEYVLVTEGLPEGVQRVVIERMPQLAFLVPGERSGGIAFEHEMLFSFFLGQVLRHHLSSRNIDGTRIFLSRSVLPIEVTNAALRGSDRELDLSVPEATQELMDLLASACNMETPRTAQVRENAGLVAEAVIKISAAHGTLRDLTVRGMVFPGGDLRNVVMESCRFKDLELRRVDLSNTQLLRCIADGVCLNEIIIDLRRTRLELEGLRIESEVIGLAVREGGLNRGIFNPTEMRRALAAVGATAYIDEEESQRERRILDDHRFLLERLLRAYRRSNPVCTADDNLQAIFRHPGWQGFERILLRHRIVTKEIRSTSGRPKEFLRRQFLPEEIMAGADRLAPVSSTIRSFWEELEREASP